MSGEGSGTQVRTINCYLYDNEATAFLMQGVIRFVQARRLMNVIFRRSWTNGFHMKISFPTAEADNGIEAVIRRLAERYSRPRLQTEYDNYENILHKQAELENYTGNYLPLRMDGEVTVEEEVEFHHRNAIGSLRMNYEIELLKSQLLVDLFDTWAALSEERQNIECAKIFLINVNRSAGGLRYGYLSLRANLEYIKGQMELSGRQNGLEWNAWEHLFHRTEEEQQFIQVGLQRFAEGKYEREFIFGRMQIFIDCLLTILNQAFENGEITLQKLLEDSDFIQRYDALNDFHLIFHSLADFQKHCDDKGFIIYRMIDSILYSLMSLLQVSAVRKQLISGLIAETVEQGLSLSWREAYQELSAVLMNGETNERMVH
ncbi:hypothetical protein [Paenibacillus sp. GCM10012306]|uniref:hypothetical protein n=1 Tax=Paenibacillus sp. GCM10012306 TaxID=3317342 RepID=UPI0036D32234